MSESTSNPGVSIVICCHNSAGRLKPTLEHLKRQVVPPGLAWEVLVIDNASTDDTARVAPGLWNEDKAAPLRVVAEPKMGLSNARARGFAEARFDLVSFVDDDNWVAPDWVAKVFEIMASHPEVGACGGRSEAVFEVPPPAWFERHQTKFAVGTQARNSGGVEEGYNALWGAGLTVRKSVWLNLLENGFQPYLTDRKGKSLTSGGDTELCFAIRLAGWKLWYDQDLKLSHFMPANRLTWEYLRRLHRGFGATHPGISPYKILLNSNSITQRGNYSKIWLMKIRSEIDLLFSLKSKWSKYLTSSNDDDVLNIEWLIFSILQFFRMRGEFDRRIDELKTAKWNVLLTSSKKAIST